MCGIAGAVSTAPTGTTRPASGWMQGVVERMSDAERHRGPDGAGCWRASGGEVVFGHRRLAIIDLSPAGAQPMVDPASGLVVTFNGEIYNYREVRAELAALGEEFRSASDTEVILKACARWGVHDAVARFRGIFALGLWDPKARAVHLVRDPMGIKPLYWTTVREPDGSSVVLFASEVRALLASGAVPRRLDPSAVASYLWHGFVIGPETILDGVRLLPAATVLTLDVDAPGAARERRYWTLPSSAGRATAVEDLRAELARTVRMQLVADVPLGIFLSGGVDSSAIAALACEAAPGAVHTFTIGFDVASHDESRYAQQVADALGTSHQTVTLTEGAFEDQLPAAFAAIDQPTFDAINTYFVSRSARDAGMTVALAGTGGDELFGGYPTYVDIPRARRALGWLPAADGAVRGAVSGGIAAAGRVAGRVLWDAVGVAPPQTRWAKALDLACAVPDALGLYQVSYALFTRETQGALAAGPVRAAQARQRFGLPADVWAEWTRRIGGSRLRHQIALLELQSFVGERLLRDTDTASMAASLEVRVPLLDHVLVESVAGIEDGRRFDPPRRKQLLRDLALGRLDPAIFERPKSGFVLPIDTWARRRLQPQMHEVLTDRDLARRVGLEGGRVATLWRSFLDGRPGMYWSRPWALYVLLAWCRTHDVQLAA